jgi:glycosyltransferase involved in cell wall biosynthesis
MEFIPPVKAPVVTNGKTLRIGLNLLYLRPGKVGGGETYARGLLDGLQQVSSSFEYFVFLNSAAFPTFGRLDDFPNFRRIACSNPLNPVLRHAWEQMRFSALCREHRIDLLHSLGNVSPLMTPNAKMVTIHDLLWKHSPEHMPTLQRLLYSYMSPLSARVCDGVFTVSTHSLQDLGETLGIPKQKLFVTIEGPGQEFTTSADWNEVKKKYNIPDQYFLSVGTDKHKRLDVTLEAIKLLRGRQMPVHLVVAGERSESSKSFNTNGELRWLGFVPAEELATLYKNATALVCSSEMEGFGLPVLEAMSSGTPVIATERGSLPEVVGAGGVLVECGDVSALATTMDQLIHEPHLRADLAQRALAHVESFSWKLCAAATVKGYEEILRRRNISSPFQG